MVEYNKDKARLFPSPPIADSPAQWSEWVQRIKSTTGMSQAQIAQIVGQSAPYFSLMLRNGAAMDETKWASMRTRWHRIQEIAAICDVGFTVSKNNLLKAVVDLHEFYNTGQQNEVSETEFPYWYIHANKEERDQVMFRYCDRHGYEDDYFDAFLWSKGFDYRTLTPDDIEAIMDVTLDIALELWTARNHQGVNAIAAVPIDQQGQQ